VNDEEADEKKVSLPRLRNELSASREGDSGENHLGQTELGRGDTGDLSQEVEPGSRGIRAWKRG
jgi:hypothetical protein